MSGGKKPNAGVGGWLGRLKDALRRRPFHRKAASSIAVIGGADGPTAVFTVKGSAEDAGRQEEFLSRAAKTIAPCPHTVEETEAYLVSRYGAVPVELPGAAREMLKVNVILNFFPELIKKPDFPSRPTKRALMRYAREDTSFEQARAFPGETLALSFAAYQLPRDKGAAVVQLERTTGYLCLTNGDERAEGLMDGLTLFRGVTEEDIQERTPRFLAYAYTLKKQGRL